MRDKLNLVTAVSGVCAIVVIEILMNSLDTKGWNPAMVSFTTLCPVILSISVILGVFKYFAGEEDTGERRIVRIIRYKKWDSFGNRMKEAYSAKFSGENPAFNAEVDAHIKIMKTLGKGATKGMTWDWLRSRCKFVEIPCVVPEEEYLAEVEKTRRLDTDSIKLN